MLTKFFRAFWFRVFLSDFRWYRKWYGGRWELHYIDCCKTAMWLEMHKGKCWPKYRQPCSFGTPIIEDW